jgi:hypothetical protein
MRQSGITPNDIHTVDDVPITYGKRRGTPSKLSALTAGSRIFKTILSCALSSMRL